VTPTEEQDRLAEQFEARRPRLKAIAYRMLGSLSEADDAVQEAWVRLGRTDEDIDNLDAWLTTVVARVCLNMLRSRESRREEPMGPRVPDPIVDPQDGTSPEHEALLADSVGLALFVVLETLSPAQRLAFVLHDVFAVPFDDIAPILGRSPDATRQLASRARRRVRGAPVPDVDLEAQREVVDAFFAAARENDFERLLSVLDPDIALRHDDGAFPPGASIEVHGAEAVAKRAQAYSRLDLVIHPALVNGAAGVVIQRDGELFSVGAFVVRGGRIVEIDFLADRERLSELDLQRDAPPHPQGLRRPRRSNRRSA
jgi:RNA polymerase sigma factor (sigma-70 family)